MINYFVIKRVNIFTLEYDGLKIYSDDKRIHFSINELEKIILEKTGINMKLSFKDIEDHFPEFGIRVSTDNIKNENIIENKIKVVHHDYNGQKYDNSILLKSLCDIYKDEMTLNCIGNSCEALK